MGEVVVVEGNAGGDGAVPAAPPEYVTRGELEALLALRDERFDQRVGEVASASWEARAAAEQALDEAATATLVSEVAAQAAGEAVAVAEEAASAPAETDEGDAAPKPPEPRKAKPAPEDEDQCDEPESKSSGYGAKSIYGSR